MNKRRYWVGIILVTPFLLFICLYIFTRIIQMWPEPISDTFNSACGYELPKTYSVSDRSHSYSNWMHGVWYTDRGKVKLDPSEAAAILDALVNNAVYSSKGATFERFDVGKSLATCSVSTKSGIVEYELVLW